MKANILVVVAILISGNYLFAGELDKELGKIANESKYLDTTNNSYQFNKIVETNQKKDSCFHKAIKWVAVTYNSANDVIQLSNPESGDLICKAKMGENTYYTVEISIKDNKARIKVYDFTYRASFGSALIKYDMSETNDETIRLLANTQKIYMKDEIPKIIESFQNYLLTKDDW